MTKTPLELENPAVVIRPSFKRPSLNSVKFCRCGCGKEIDTGMDSYIVIDGDVFMDDECVVTHFIKEAGGRRVYGGAC